MPSAARRSARRRPAPAGALKNAISALDVVVWILQLIDSPLHPTPTHPRPPALTQKWCRPSPWLRCRRGNSCCLASLTPTCTRRSMLTPVPARTSRSWSGWTL